MEGLITSGETLTGYSQRLWKQKKHLQLATQWLASRSCTSQPSPRVCPFPLSDADRYQTILQYHYPCGEHRAIPLSCQHPLRQSLLFASLSYNSMLLLRKICRLWQCGENRTNS